MGKPDISLHHSYKEPRLFSLNFPPNILELPPAQCTFIYWFTLTCQWKYDCIAPQCKCLWSHCYEIVCHRNESCRIEQENEVWNSVLMTHSPTPFFFFFFCQIFLWAWFWFVRKALVGQLPGDHKVYKITKIVVIPLSEDEPQDLELEVINADCFV